MFADDLLARPSRDQASNRRADFVDKSSSDVMRRARSRAEDDVEQAGLGSALNGTALSRHHGQAYVLQNRDRIGKLLRLFSSPRKRFGLTPDELLIFFAVGYLCTTISNGAIQITPIGLIDVSMLLGIPKETVRRKAAKLAGLEYVSCTPKGVLIKEVRIWCDMLERALT